MLSTLHTLSALLLSFAILSLGHGLQGTLLGVRGSLEGYSTWQMGLIGSGFFLGMMIGISLAGRLIARVGQIRVFAAFASLASAVALLHVMFMNPYSWFVLRLVYGICIAGLFMIIESWLNMLAIKETRGRVFSVYMVLSFLGMALGQSVLFIYDSAGMMPFIVISVLMSISLVPVTISRTRQPDSFERAHFGLRELFRASPLATIGSGTIGLALGAFWGLVAVNLTELGLEQEQTASFISLSLVGGLVLQWPIGALSDAWGRRPTILATVSLNALIVFMLLEVLFLPSLQEDMVVLYGLAFLFGGTAFPLYALFNALANDFLEPEKMLKASAGLLYVNAFGALCGPMIVAGLDVFLGQRSVFLFILGTQLMTASFAMVRILRGRQVVEEHVEQFVPMARATGAAIFRLDPHRGSDNERQ